MTGADFASYVRYLTNTNSTTFTDDEIVLLANAIQRPLARKIANLDEGEFEISMTRDLVASTDFDAREYDVDYDIMRIKRLEAKPDGSTWIRFDKFKHNAYQKPSTESDVRSNFGNSENKAFYDVSRRSLWLFCGEITAVSEGMKLWAQVYPINLVAGDLALSTELSIPTTSKTFRIPSDFHEIWGRMISRIHRMSKDKPLPVTEMEAAIKPDLDELLNEFNNSTLEENALVGGLPDDRRLQGM